MVKFRTNVDNNEYITINKSDLMLMVVMDKTPQEIKDISNDIFVETLDFQKNNRAPYISEIEIRKDSLLGTYLLENGMSDKIRNEDLYIYFGDVVNAFNVATYSNNQIMHLLICMFRERVEGNVFDLSKKYGKEAVNYIVNNKDFKLYLEKLYDIYKPRECIVYEDGAFSKKTLLSKQKQKVK